MNDDETAGYCCVVCGRICDYDQELGRHIHGARVPDDHPVVPMRAAEYGWERVIIRCDFCGHDHKSTEVWTIPARTFDEPQVPGDRPRRSIGDWVACRYCQHLVKTGRWHDLVERVLIEHETSVVASTSVRYWITQLYTELSKNITGEPYRGFPARGNELPQPGEEGDQGDRPCHANDL